MNRRTRNFWLAIARFFDRHAACVRRMMRAGTPKRGPRIPKVTP